MVDEHNKLALKSKDTEEWIDTIYTRPIGLLWAKFFNLFNIHPNVVTILSIIIGVSSSYFFFFDANSTQGLIYNAIGVVLLTWANFYDSADGQLARMTGKKSQLGRILDGFAGDAWFFCIYVALFLRMFHKPIFAINGKSILQSLSPLIDFSHIHWGYGGLLLVIFIGFVCHARQCGLADYYRNIHLYFIKGKEGSELDNYKQQKINYDSVLWSKQFLWKLFMWFYVRYTKSQENQTPNFQKFNSLLKQKYNGHIPQEIRNEFRTKSLPLMKWTNILTFNIRALVLYVSCLIDIPWLYLMFELIILTILYFYMRYKHENICKQFINNIKENKYKTN